MKCLNCDTDFTAKRITAKYCSDNCRVKAFLKKGKKEKIITETKLQVLYNSLLEMVGKFNVSPMPNVLDIPKPTRIFNDEPPKWEQPEITRKPKSVVKYVSERLQIETPEAFEAWLKELDSDPYLSDRDKKDAKTKIL